MPLRQATKLAKIVSESLLWTWIGGSTNEQGCKNDCDSYDGVIDGWHSIDNG